MEPQPGTSPDAAADADAGALARLTCVGSPEPYPGLRPFTRDESDIFFGRDELVDELLRRLDRSRFLGIVGVSGCGKSSLLRAGLIPALETGFLGSAGVRWQTAEMRPGSRPMRRLAEVLYAAMPASEPSSGVDAVAFIEESLRRGPRGIGDVLREHEFPDDVNLLLVVDQFEEIFRYREVDDADEADAFVALLLETAHHCQRVFVVLGMRSDFLGECAVFTGLPEALNESQFLVPRLSREQRREAIVGPAGVFDAVVDPRTVNHLLNEMGSDPDQLPLMQHLLMRMWEHARARGGARIELTDEDYRAAGGLRGALSQHAEEAFAGLDPEQRRLAEVLFRCATEYVANKQDRRRPIRLHAAAAVAGVPWQQMAGIVEIFRRAPNTFLTPPAGVELADDSIIDITHESLIRAWDRLRGWVFDEGVRTERYRQVAEAARTWHANRRDSEWLMSGAKLDEALRWRDATAPNAAWAQLRGPDLALTLEFIGASSRRRRRTRAAAGLGVALLLLLALGWGYRERQKALDDIARQAEDIARKAKEIDDRKKEQERQENIRLSYDLANRALLGTQRTGASIDLTALLGVEAVSRFVSSRSWQALTESLRLLPHRAQSLPAPDTRALAFDGMALVAVSGDGLVRTFNGDVPLTTAPSCGNCEFLAVSPTGRFVALGDERTIVVDDRRTRRPVGRVSRSPEIQQVVVSDDGNVVAVTSATLLERIPLDGRRRTTVRLTDSDAYLSPDARLAAIWDGNSKTIAVRSLESGATIFRFNLDPLTVVSAVISGDGTHLAAALSDGTVRAWSLRRGFEKSRAALGGLAKGRGRLALANDGRYLAVTTLERVRVFDLRTKSAREMYRIEIAGRRGAVFSPDGQHLAVAGTGGISTWEPTTGGEFAHIVDDVAIDAVAVSADAAWAATASNASNDGGVIRLWALPAGERRGGELAVEGTIRSLAFAPDGQSLFAVRQDGGVCQFPTASLQAHGIARRRVSAAPAAGPAPCLPGDGHFGALSADGRRLAVASSQRTITVSDVTGGAALHTRAAPPSLIALSRDGAHAASVGIDKVIWTWDVGAPATAHTAAPIEAHDPVVSLAISPDGSYVAWSTRSGNTSLRRIIGADPGEEVHTLNLDAQVRDFDFSPSGRYLLYGDQNGTLRVWDITEQRGIAELSGDQPIVDVAFSADERYLIAASGQVARVLLWQSKDLVEEACTRLNRPFTFEDWTQYVGQRVSYENRCPNLQATPGQGLEEARRLLGLGRVENAVALYDAAAASNAVVAAEDWYRVCREGTLWGRPDAVLAACDRAVGNDGGDVRRWRYLAWRGAARAITGHRVQGIQDLQQALASAEKQGAAYEARQRLSDYIGILRADGDPFHPDDLRSFMD